MGQQTCLQSQVGTRIEQHRNTEARRRILWGRTRSRTPDTSPNLSMCSGGCSTSSGLHPHVVPVPRSTPVVNYLKHHWGMAQRYCRRHRMNGRLHVVLAQLSMLLPSDESKFLEKTTVNNLVAYVLLTPPLSMWREHVPIDIGRKET